MTNIHYIWTHDYDRKQDNLEEPFGSQKGFEDAA